jgi:uncharacterized protein
MEVLMDMPASAPNGVAVVAHPQPLQRGSAHHKIPHFLARGLVERGWLAVRPNFRGVGASEGAHDHGAGETEDVVVLVARLREAHPHLPLALLGFSFGAFVQSRVAHRLTVDGNPACAVVLAGMPAGRVEGGRHYAPEGPSPHTLVVHGERDERVPLHAVFDWARAHAQPVVVVPGADHFFTGRLPVLRSLALSHVASCGAQA